MNEMRVARGLGWFSIGLGITEALAARELSRTLGMERRSWLFRLFGAREIATGVTILASDRPSTGIWARVAGDVLDLAALVSGFTPDNPKKLNLALAIGTVVDITLLDFWCARRLHSARPHGSQRVHDLYVAKEPTIEVEAQP
jgi:hypothetical protein